MNNKLILTSLLAMAVVSPAVGVSFTEIMETNKTYENAATKQNMGVDAGTVTAEAYYTIYPGYYLPANSYTPAVCPAGSYCAGLEQTTKSTTAKGLTSCQQTNTYTQSDQGADAVYDCYASCPAPTNADHLASNGSFSGKLYYGDLKNCAPSACAAGYTMLNINASTTFLNNSSERFIYVDSTTGVTSTTAFSNKYGSYGSSEAILGAVGFITGDTWAVDFDDGLLYGGSKKVNSSAAGPVSAVEAMSVSTTGQCYCWLTGYKPSGSANRRVVRSLAVPVPEIDWSGRCPEACARLLATNMSGMPTDELVAAKTMLLERATNDQKCIEAPYTITYSCGTGTGTPGTQNVEYNTNYTSKAGSVCTKTGYTFINWEVGVPGSSGEPYVAGNTTLPYAYTSDETYTAKWEAKTSSVTLKNNGATVDIVTATYDRPMPKKNTSNASLTRPTRTSAVFTGYYDNSATPVQYYTKDLNSARNWNKEGNQELTAHFDDCACTKGTGVSECTFDQVSELNRCRYNITYAPGYYGTATQSSVDGVGTLNAVAAACSNKPANSTYTNGDNTDGNACPWACPTGHSVTGKKAGATTGHSIDDSALTCSAINDYAITYTWNGGSCSGTPATTYTYGVGATLCTPTKEGYTFAGWTGGNGSTPQTNVTISATTAGDKAYTANWTTNTINIVWTRIASASVQTADNKAMSNFDSTNNTAKSQVSYNGSIFTPKSVMEVTGQKFVGWKFVK